MSHSKDTLILDKLYTIDRELGSGGFAVVWRAYDENKNKVAIKQIDSSEDDCVGVPCLMEASVMAAYKHPYLNNAISIKVADNSLYIIQKEATGGTLHSWVDVNTISDRVVLSVISSIGQGLAFLHADDIIHGDVKPTNILVFNGDNGPIFKLSDFNLATHKRWNSHIPVCTTSYRPIEAWSLKNWDEKVDIWGLGCVAYYVKYRISLFDSQKKSNWPLPNGKTVSGRYLNALYDWERIWYSQSGLAEDTAPRRPYDKSIDYRQPDDNKDIFDGSKLNQFILTMLAPQPDQRPSARQIVDNSVLDSVYYLKKNGHYHILTPLQVTNGKIPKLSDKPKNIVISEENVSYSKFLGSYTDNEIISQLADRIYSRYSKLNTIDEDDHCIKTAILWIASKMVRINDNSELIPDVEPRISTKKICRIEREICRKLEFILH